MPPRARKQAEPAPTRRTNRFREDIPVDEVAPLPVDEDEDLAETEADETEIVYGYTEPEPVQEVEDTDDIGGGLLTEHARVVVTIGTQFSYRNHSHWPKVEIADGPFPIVDESGEPLGWEDTEDMLYRIEETAHRRLDIIIDRMKVDIDARIAADAARVRRERGLPTS